jgi:hypothetical protein
MSSRRPTPTNEQELAIAAFSTGEDLVLEAGAGTGKTSTLLMLANRAEERGLYLAYNKAIATEAGSKFPPHVPTRTAHSLAYRELGYQYKDHLASDRMSLSQVASFLGLNQVYVEGNKRLSSGTLARLAMEMVERFCQSAEPQVTVRHRPFVEGIEDLDALGELLLPFARKAWADLLGTTGRLRFNHDHYLKMWQLTDPTLPCEFVLFDEAQDANPCIAHIVARQGAQRIYVGDRAQSIYGWRGAVDAMDIPDVTRLFLSKSFRFGQPIADEANRWLELLDTPLRLTGNEEINSFVDFAGEGGELTNPRAVLCRTNGTAFETLIKAQERGTKVHLQGGGNEIVSFCKGADELKSRGSSSHRDLTAFTTWADVQDYVDEDKSAGDLKVMVALIDKYGTERLVEAIRKMYPDEETAELTVSTAHKAKGREWDSVRVADDFAQRVNELGEPVELSREDIMLRYVAVTRAQYALDRGPLAKPVTYKSLPDDDRMAALEEEQ